MPARTQKISKELDESVISSLHEVISSTFQGAQASYTSHKRRIKTLCKIHSEAIKHVRQVRRNGSDSVILLGEKEFNRAFWEVVVCMLEVKKGVVEADRAIRFLGQFVGALCSEEGNMSF